MGATITTCWTAYPAYNAVQAAAFRISISMDSAPVRTILPLMAFPTMIVITASHRLDRQLFQAPPPHRLPWRVFPISTCNPTLVLNSESVADRLKTSD